MGGKQIKVDEGFKYARGTCYTQNEFSMQHGEKTLCFEGRPPQKTVVNCCSGNLQLSDCGTAPKVAAAVTTTTTTTTIDWVGRYKAEQQIVQQQVTQLENSGEFRIVVDTMVDQCLNEMVEAEDKLLEVQAITSGSLLRRIKEVQESMKKYLNDYKEGEQPPDVEIQPRSSGQSAADCPSVSESWPPTMPVLKTVSDPVEQERWKVAQMKQHVDQMESLLRSVKAIAKGVSEKLQALLKKIKSEESQVTDQKSEQVKEARVHVDLLRKAFLGADEALGNDWRGLYALYLQENKLKAGEHVSDRFINWAEDLKGAVRVYLKVTNRERQSGSMQASTNMLTCAHPGIDNHGHPSYVPDRKVRMFDCEKPVPSMKCSDFLPEDAPPKDTGLEAFGPYFGIFASDDNQLDMFNDNPQNGKDVYGSTDKWAPGMNSVMHQVLAGYTVVLFGYGYSGSGKTFTLLGSGPHKGLVTIGLHDIRNRIDFVSVRFKELYGRMKLEDGRPLSGETGIYSYKLERSAGKLISDPCIPMEGENIIKAGQCLNTSFWGRDPMQGTTPAEAVDESPGNFVGYMDGDKLDIPGEEIGEFLDEALGLVLNTRVHARCRTSEHACPRVKATPNNPESSRGHLFMILDVTLKGSTGPPGTIVVVDMAGAENPLAIAKDYIDYSVLGWDDQQIDHYVGENLKNFDRFFGTRYKLWQSTSEPHKAINMASAEQFLDPARVAELRSTSGRSADNNILKAWVEEHVEPLVVPMVAEGVFINEGLNHMQQFLLQRGGKIPSLTQGVKQFHWEERTRELYEANSFIKPADSSRYRLALGGIFNTANIRDHVAHIESAGCIIDWTPQCNKFGVDGFLRDHRKTIRPENISKQLLTSGEIAKVDPMLMISMLRYFDHPEFYRPPVGQLDPDRPLTKFIMVAHVRREHPETASSKFGKRSEKLTDKQYKELKRNICHGARTTLAFTQRLNPLAADVAGTR